MNFGPPALGANRECYRRTSTTYTHFVRAQTDNSGLSTRSERNAPGEEFRPGRVGVGRRWSRVPASDGTVSGLSAYDDRDSDDDRDEDERQADDLQADRCVQRG